MIGAHCGAFFVGTGCTHGITVFDAFLFGHQLTAENRLRRGVDRKSAATGQDQAGGDEAE
jgi:hypothetical protein